MNTFAIQYPFKTLMKKKIILLAACMFLAAVNLSAKSLVLTLKNGTLVYYLLGGESNPMMRFVEGSIVVNTDKYEFGNVKNFYISDTDDPTGVEQAIGAPIQYDHNTIVVSTDNTLPVSMYTCGGHKVEVHIQQSNGRILIDLNPLPQGAYVVTIGESSLKVLKK